uniref:Uncharacterized protein n=1 Tax=Rhizophora mucronata TaxID=61149 RepID=A0A2P2N053_RHIMU
MTDLSFLIVDYRGGVQTSKLRERNIRSKRIISTELHVSMRSWLEAHS